MDQWTPNEYMVFRKMDGNIIPGMSVKAVLSVAAALILAVVLFVGMGMATHEVSKPLGYTDASAVQTEYVNRASALIYLEQKRELPQSEWELKLGGMRQYTLGSFTDEQIEQLALEAIDLGMTKETTREQAQAMAPKTGAVQEPIVPGTTRAIIALLPAILLATLLFENKGISLHRELGVWAEWSRAQKNYYHG